MTNWLDPDEVKAAYDKAESTRGKWSAAATNDYHAYNAVAVLSALAELDPRQLQAYGCDELCNRNNPISNAAGKPCDCSPGHFFRIWRVALVVTGKEDGRDAGRESLGGQD
jgi:hypothetical protein